MTQTKTRRYGRVERSLDRGERRGRETRRLGSSDLNARRGERTYASASVGEVVAQSHEVENCGSPDPSQACRGLSVSWDASNKPRIDGKAVTVAVVALKLPQFSQKPVQKPVAYKPLPD
jgi:hypothetical protein